jgi:hypothetical protein
MINSERVHRSRGSSDTGIRKDQRELNLARLNRVDGVAAGVILRANRRREGRVLATIAAVCGGGTGQPREPLLCHVFSASNVILRIQFATASATAFSLLIQTHI